MSSTLPDAHPLPWPDGFPQPRCLLCDRPMLRVDLGRSHWAVCFDDRLKRWLGFNLFPLVPGRQPINPDGSPLSGLTEVP